MASETLAYANLVRQQLPEKYQYAIALPVQQLGENGTVEYSEVEEYMTRIQATPAERERCMLGMQFPRESGDIGKTTTADLDRWREWIRSESPDLVERGTAGVIAGLFQNTSYPDVVELALHYHEVGGSDEVLIPVLDNYQTAKNKELARSIASKLSDSDLRGKYLQKFK